MTITEVENYLSNLTSHVTFELGGVSCGIDPLSRNKFEMWYGSDDITANSIDEVMNMNFFDGKPLKEIWNDITGLEY